MKTMLFVSEMTIYGWFVLCLFVTVGILAVAFRIQKNLIKNPFLKILPPILYTNFMDGLLECTDSKIKNILERCHTSEMAFGMRSDISKDDFPDWKMEISSSDSKFFDYQLHPIIGTQYWYRGYAISVDDGVVVIMRGWSMPHSTSFPVLYTKGKVKIETVENVVTIFYSKVMNKLGEDFARISTSQ